MPRPPGARLVGGAATLLVTLLAAAALTALDAGPAAATAEPVGQCTATSGVILAVDFRPWGGPMLRACGSTPTTGYSLLNQGGWHTEGTLHDGPGFICRIGYAGYAGGNGYPTTATDACKVTPPATAYWSFWHANPGQRTWSYSQVGPAADHPLPGSVELWTFGATSLSGSQGVPAVSPDALRARAAPSSTAVPTRTASAPAAASSRPAGTRSPKNQSVTPGTSAGPLAAAAAPGAVATGGRSPTGSPGAADLAAAAIDAPPATLAPASAGSPLPALGGLALVAALGGAAGWARWRRRADSS